MLGTAALLLTLAASQPSAADLEVAKQLVDVLQLVREASGFQVAEAQREVSSRDGRALASHLALQWEDAAGGKRPTIDPALHATLREKGKTDGPVLDLTVELVYSLDRWEKRERRKFETVESDARWERLRVYRDQWGVRRVFLPRVPAANGVVAPQLARVSINSDSAAVLADVDAKLDDRKLMAVFQRGDDTIGRVVAPRRSRAQVLAAGEQAKAVEPAAVSKQAAAEKLCAACRALTEAERAELGKRIGSAVKVLLARDPGAIVELESPTAKFVSLELEKRATELAPTTCRKTTDGCDPEHFQVELRQRHEKGLVASTLELGGSSVVPPAPPDGAATKRLTSTPVAAAWIEHADQKEVTLQLFLARPPAQQPVLAATVTPVRRLHLVMTGPKEAVEALYAQLNRGALEGQLDQ